MIPLVRALTGVVAGDDGGGADEPAGRRRGGPSGRDQPGHPRHRGHAGRGAIDGTAARRPGPGGHRRGSAGPDPPAHADGRPHPAAAGDPDHVRPEGGRLAGRAGRRHRPLGPTARRATRRRSWAGRRERWASSTGGASRSSSASPAASASTRRSLAWHTDRSRVAEVAGGLAVAAGVVGKVALDVVLLAQTEVGEVRRGGARPGRLVGHAPQGQPGGRRAGPGGRRPGARACRRPCWRAMAQEHERAAGSWHAEWRPLTELLRATGSAAAWLADCLAHLEIDAERMAHNLRSSGDLWAAEAAGGRAGAEARQPVGSRPGGRAQPPGDGRGAVAGFRGWPTTAGPGRRWVPTGLAGAARPGPRRTTTHPWARRRRWSSGPWPITPGGAGRALPGQRRSRPDSRSATEGGRGQHRAAVVLHVHAGRIEQGRVDAHGPGAVLDVGERPRTRRARPDHPGRPARTAPAWPGASASRS